MGEKQMKLGRLFASGAVAACLFAGAASAQTPAESAPDQLAFRELFRERTAPRASLSGGECTLAAERMAAHLWAAGYSRDDARVLVPESHPNEGALVAVLRGSDPSAPALLLLAHIDVVEARREDWERDPFVLVEEGGYFYGRGTQDDKAQAAIWVDTLIRLRAEGFQPRRHIKVALTCGEETSDAFNTLSWLLTNHRDAVQAGFALNEDIRARLDPDGTRIALEIMAGEKVYHDFQLETTHPGGHSSRPVPGNAIYRLADGLSRLDDYTFPLEIHGTRPSQFTTGSGQRHLPPRGRIEPSRRLHLPAGDQRHRPRLFRRHGGRHAPVCGRHARRQPGDTRPRGGDPPGRH